MVKRKFVLGLLCLLVLAIISCGIFSHQMIASAAEVNNDGQITEEQNAEVSPRLFTSISIAIGGGNGEVWAQARNDFTLGFATVIVYIELYSSYTYQDAYFKMNIEGRNNTADLNIFETLDLSAPTNGIQKYWMARMRYRVDGGAWQESLTSVWLIDGNGNKVQ